MLKNTLKPEKKTVKVQQKKPEVEVDENTSFLQSTIKSLNQELNQKNQSILDQLNRSNELESINTTLFNLLNEISTYLDDIIKIQSKKDHEKQSDVKLLESNNTLALQLSSLQSTYNELNEKFNQTSDYYSKSISTQHQECLVLQQDLLQVTDSLYSEKQKNATLLEKFNALDKEYQSLFVEKNHVYKRYKEIVLKLKDSESKNEAALKTNSDLNTQLKLKSEANTQLEHENADLKAYIEDLKARFRVSLERGEEASFEQEFEQVYIDQNLYDLEASSIPLADTSTGVSSRFR